jgi:hypothetical protein
VIFAFAFLVISILISFGLYLILLSTVILTLTSISEFIPDSLGIVITIVSLVMMLTLLITGLIYMIDYLTLGFFKKISWFAKIYYPIYTFYNIITLSALSRSIYYYMISKFSKKRIRLIYIVAGFLLFFTVLFDFDQYQYFPGKTNASWLESNYYDNLRQEDTHVNLVSITSDYVDRPYFPLFLRYYPVDNSLIKKHCPDFKPLKVEGLNTKLQTRIVGGNLWIGSEDYSNEDFDQLLQCQSAIYQILVNDSVYNELKFRFYIHPSKEQKGLITTIPTDNFLEGENILAVKKVVLDSANNIVLEDYAYVPFWYHTAN